MRVIYTLLVCFISFSIAAQSGRPLKVHIYPESPDKYMNLYIDWDRMQPFSVAIYDSNRILQHEWREKAVQHYQKSIFLEQMPAGRYYMIISTAADSLRKDFTIYRKAGGGASKLK